MGLFDNLSFDESSVRLSPGDIFIAYSDGVTEPKMTMVSLAKSGCSNWCKTIATCRWSGSLRL